MDQTRRDLALWLPLLLSGRAAADDTSVLPSKAYSFDSLAAKTNSANGMEIRQVFKGKTQTGCPLALHISTLPPGEMPHPPHRHVHEELMLIKDGILQFTISGQVSTVGPGSAVYINSNELHGMKNVGKSAAQYFVVEIGAESA
jgi:mannose-6-phosphate isomerase-like protein (cupin superfamily)